MNTYQDINLKNMFTLIDSYSLLVRLNLFPSIKYFILLAITPRCFHNRLECSTQTLEVFV